MMDSVVVTNDGELVENEMMDSVAVTNEGGLVGNGMMISAVMMKELMNAWVLGTK